MNVVLHWVQVAAQYKDAWCRARTISGQRHGVDPAHPRERGCSRPALLLLIVPLCSVNCRFNVTDLLASVTSIQRLLCKTANLKTGYFAGDPIMISKSVRLAGAAAVLALSATGAQAALQTLTITGAAHTFYGVGSSQTSGVINQFGGPTGAYGDGATAGISPVNLCSISGACPASTYSVALNAGGTPQQNYTVNAAYWGSDSNANGRQTPTATYSGSITYDDVTGVVTGGALNWTGVYGAEFVINSPTAAGSFYGLTFLNGSINLATGARTGTFRCDVGAAGYAVVGTSAGGGGPYSPLCAFQSQASYGYSGQVSGNDIRAFTYNAGVLSLAGNKYALGGGGNNLLEVFAVTTVPVPGAVWLFGSALGLMGLARRKLTAA